MSRSLWESLLGLGTWKGGPSRLHLQIDGFPTAASCKGPDQPPGGVCAHMVVGHGVGLQRALGRADLGSTEGGGLVSLCPW